MYKLLVDVPVSRRQSLCHIFDGTGTIRWSGKNVAAGLQWLIDNGQIEVRLEGENGAFMLSISPLQE